MRNEFANPTTVPTQAVARPGSVLIVDDDEPNRTLLRDPLEAHGYQVAEAENGFEALKKVAAQAPDIILLDVMMPGMDGFELCRKLQAEKAFKEIPIIFISSLDEALEKVRALMLGGVDYITKPVRYEEVEARIRTHLELRRQKRSLQESYQRLQELEVLRDGLTHMIVHDLRSPLTAIIMALEMVREHIPVEDEELTRLVQLAQDSALRIKDMAGYLLDINRLEAGQMPLNKSECELGKVAHSVVEMLTASAAQRQILVTAPQAVTVLCDPEIIRRVIENLVSNAIKFTPANGQIEILISSEQAAARVSVKDNGPGIPPEYHEKIFQKFGQVEGEHRTLGTGLGLTFCKLAVEAHGGRLGVQSQIGQGSTFWFTIPLRQSIK